MYLMRSSNMQATAAVDVDSAILCLQISIFITVAVLFAIESLVILESLFLNGYLSCFHNTKANFIFKVIFTENPIHWASRIA